MYIELSSTPAQVARFLNILVWARAKHELYFISSRLARLSSSPECLKTHLWKQSVWVLKGIEILNDHRQQLFPHLNAFPVCLRIREVSVLLLGTRYNQCSRQGNGSSEIDANKARIGISNVEISNQAADSTTKRDNKLPGWLATVVSYGSWDMPKLTGRSAKLCVKNKNVNKLNFVLCF